MILITLQLLINYIFFKFFDAGAWKWYKITAVLVFPILTVLSVFLSQFAMFFSSNASDAIAVSVNNSFIWRSVFFCVLSLAIQLFFNKQIIASKKANS